MTSSHLKVFGCAVHEQLGANIEARLGNPLRLGRLAEATEVQPAFALKLVDDLTRNGLFVDCGINVIGGYWGTQAFAVSSFGLAFALYLEDASFFLGEHAPDFETGLTRRCS